MYYDMMTPIRHPYCFPLQTTRDSRQITLEGQTEKSLVPARLTFLFTLQNN